MPETTHPAADRLRAAFPNDGIVACEFRGQWRFDVPRASVPDVLRLLKEDPDLRFDFLNDVTCTDHPDDDERFRVIWTLTSMKRKERVRVTARCPEDDAVVPSATALWATADWLEREAYDMFGVRFAGHPDLRRILMPADFDAWPLRKEFPMEGTRSDRDWARWVIDRARRPEGDRP